MSIDSTSTDHELSAIETSKSESAESGTAAGSTESTESAESATAGSTGSTESAQSAESESEPVAVDRSWTGGSSGTGTLLPGRDSPLGSGNVNDVSNYHSTKSNSGVGISGMEISTAGRAFDQSNSFRLCEKSANSDIVQKRGAESHNLQGGASVAASATTSPETANKEGKTNNGGDSIDEKRKNTVICPPVHQDSPAEIIPNTGDNISPDQPFLFKPNSSHLEPAYVALDIDPVPSEHILALMKRATAREARQYNVSFFTYLYQAPDWQIHLALAVSLCVAIGSLPLSIAIVPGETFKPLFALWCVAYFFCHFRFPMFHPNFWGESRQLSGRIISSVVKAGDFASNSRFTACSSIAGTLILSLIHFRFARPQLAKIGELSKHDIDRLSESIHEISSLDPNSEGNNDRIVVALYKLQKAINETISKSRHVTKFQYLLHEVFLESLSVTAGRIFAAVFGTYIYNSFFK
jgi:hypothetical protein